MDLRLEEHRISISEFATIDSEIESLRERFTAVEATLVGFARNRDREGYTVVVEELCRISRRLIWTFVRSCGCQETQVASVMELFESCDFSAINTFDADHPDVVDFTEAIKRRANRLRVAIESYQVEVFSEDGELDRQLTID